MPTRHPSSDPRPCSVACMGQELVDSFLRGGPHIDTLWCDPTLRCDELETTADQEFQRDSRLSILGFLHSFTRAGDSYIQAFS